MIIKNGKENLKKIVQKQISSLFLDELSNLDKCIENALLRFEQCCKNSKNKYYKAGGVLTFSPMHSGQYCIFLWILSSELSNNKFTDDAEKIYLLNKCLNSVDWFYDLQLPKKFYVEHPVGGILGRAKYGENLFLYQNVTIGGNLKNGTLFYPNIGNNVICFANTTILGSSTIGNNVMVSAGTILVNETIPDNTIVFRNGKMKHYTEAEMVSRISHFFEIEGNEQ